MKKKKICIVVNSRANYGRIKSVLLAIKDHPKMELQLVVGASALLYRYGLAIQKIKDDGFEPAAVIHSVVEGETPITMAKSTGLGIIELSSVLFNLKPDIVLTVADRYETIATAIAASYMNIPVAHTQGGEVTGSIDENVRHAITKLSHIHFPATERAKEFLLKMGEQESSIYLTGCPSIDLINSENLYLPKDLFKRYGGVGGELDSEKPYILVLQHPVTTEYGKGLEQISETLAACDSIGKSGYQIIWLWPNVDAGSDDISKGLRQFRERNHAPNLHFFRNFSPEDYIKVLNNASCIVGNSSSGIREGSFLGTPCVNIGNRQRNRERASNVIDVDYKRADIESAIRKQLKHGKYDSSKLFGDGNAGQRIANILADAEIELNKTLNYLN